MIDRGLPPPFFADAAAAVAAALAEVRFPEKVAVSVATHRHRVLVNPGAFTGMWKDSPHDMRCLDRPMDCLGADQPYREVAVMGPSQTGKSEIGNNAQLHTIVYDPADTLIVFPDKGLVHRYVTTEFTKMLDAAVDADGKAGILRRRQLGGASSDNIYLKQFRGCDLHFLWPGGPNFRAKPFPRGRLDDYDDIPTDIADQGDAMSLMRGRMASFSAYGGTKIYVNSSPKLGMNRGIEALVAAGTDERWYVDCLDCGFPYPLTFDRLDYDREGTPADAAASAAVVCPDCGVLHRQNRKRELMGRGRWIGKGEQAVSLLESNIGKSGELEPNVRASFRFDGLMGFRSWSEIAQLARAAEISLDVEQDEAPLKAFDQTVVGRNYIARGKGEQPITLDQLHQRVRASGYRLGEVPPGAICLIAAIDLQGNRFEVAVWAWGADFRCWLVDRFAVLTVERDGREEPLRPFTREEDWAVLHAKVLCRTYPLAGAPALRMKIFNTVVDTGGLDNATDNAFAWWHSMVRGDVGSGRPPLPPTAITLFKGGNKPSGKLLPPPTIDAKRQIKGVAQAQLFIPNVNRIKDTAAVRLNKPEGAPGFIGFPYNLPANRDGQMPVLLEMKAESKTGDLWQRPPHAANESWDLYIMAYTAVLRFGGKDGSFGWVPEWARPPKGAPKRLPPPSEEHGPEPEDAPPAEAAPVSRIVQRAPGARRAARPKRGVRVVRGG